MARALDWQSRGRGFESHLLHISTSRSAFFIMPHFVYILYSPDRDRYYVGETQNLEKRLADHKNSRSNYTKGTTDWTLKWYIKVEDRSEGVRLEREIKNKKSRKYIEYLTSSVG